MTDTETELSTDEDILNNIGEGDEPTSSEGTEEQGDTTTQAASEQTPTASGEQSPAGGDVQQQQQPSRGPQDLVDRNGNVLARQGAERRHYETAQREKQRADNVTRELDTVKGQLEAINAAGNLGSEYSLSPQELTTGAQLISSYKTDPVGTIQFMLTQAQSSGHNIDALLGGNGGTDMNAIKQLIDNSLAPLMQEQSQRADTQAANDRATEVYNDFIGRFPDAAMHEGTLAKMLQQDTSLDPQAAYYKLQSYYAQKGLDWTKSLEQLQQEQATQPRQNTQQALPDGGMNPVNVTDTAPIAAANTSTDDIIREAMREAGIN